VPPPFARRRHHGGDRRRIPLAVCITEGIRHIDMLKVTVFMQRQADAAHRPELPGIITGGPGQGRHHSGAHLQGGRIGIVSKSGTLTYEAIHQVAKVGMGQTTCIGIGGDPLIGTSHIDALKLFADDPDTEAVIMIGEIGGTAEQEAAAYIKAHFKKPVVGFIAGQTAPPGGGWATAGAIIAGGQGTAKEKNGRARRRGRARREEPGRHGRGHERDSGTLMERTFAIIKPTPSPRRWPGQILARIEGGRLSPSARCGCST
jgi:succinyl-CoA synthetase alpha subunit